MDLPEEFAVLPVPMGCRERKRPPREDPSRCVEIVGLDLEAVPSTWFWMASGFSGAAGAWHVHEQLEVGARHAAKPSACMLTAKPTRSR
jgi:hypothetical protein